MSTQEDPLAQKSRSGLSRMLHATRYSIDGLKAGLQETAFRQEAFATLILVPLALWLGQSWLEKALLIAAVLQVMIVELLNTGIEAAIDRVGTEWHALAKRAKDMGSAAVLISLLLWVVVWLGVVLQRFC